MSENITFSPRGWTDYIFWQKENKRTLKKVNTLIKDIVRNRFKGIGNPELLKNDLSGLWSREIDAKNRLLYRVKDDGSIEIAQCRGHYDDK